MIQKYAAIIICVFVLVGMFHDGEATGGYGMTWSLASHDASTGVDIVGCQPTGVTATQMDLPNTRSYCNPYQGDSLCTRSLPILCIATDRLATYPTGLSLDISYWTKSHIATTLPVLGSSLSGLSTMNDICVASFGVGWRAAEFHDGSGWQFGAYGHVRNDIRFWVYINDQPANCWNP